MVSPLALYALVLAAVDVHNGALHPAGLLGAEKGDNLGNIARFPEPRYAELPHRQVYVLLDIDAFFPSPFLKELLPALRRHGAGLNEVHVDPVLDPLFGNRFR